MIRIFLLTTVAVTVLLTGSALASDCAFNGTTKTKKMVLPMVREFAACPSTQHPISNADTSAGTAACAPVVANGELDSYGGSYTDPSVYLFAPNGGCTAKLAAKAISDCSALEAQDGSPLGLPPVPCQYTSISASCTGVLKSDGTMPIDSGDDGWSLPTLSRWSLDDPLGGDMTVIDFPVTYVFSTPSGGKMSIDSSLEQALIPLIGASNSAMPACTNMQLVQIAIKDPTGAPFARPGLSTRPKP